MVIKNKGIYYIGQYGTSGYAVAAKGYIYHFHKSNIPITWEPLYFDDSQLSDKNIYDVTVKSLINKRVIYDTVILHCTPDLWPEFRKNRKELFDKKIIIGYCTWETDKLPKDWAKYINESVYELWVPSVYNRDIFKNNGVNVKISIVPHIFLRNNLPLKEFIEFYDKDIFTFYTIGELNERKNILGTVEAFCKAFTKKDKVRLLVKTHHKNYNIKNKRICENKLKSLIKKYPQHADIKVFLTQFSDESLNKLHSVGNCYISLTKSEGFGLPIFDTYNYGKKVIVTGYGGHIDFLGKDYDGLVKYKLDNSYSTQDKFYFKNDSGRWAYPDMKHATELMRGVYKKFLDF